MRTWLVTGGAGFIGSNFICRLLGRRRDVKIVNLDSLTYAGNCDNLSEVSQDPMYVFVKGDIRDRELIKDLFVKYSFDRVINFAAESHVDRSIDGPAVFASTNILGTQVLLDAALAAWKKYPEDRYSRDFKKDVKFIQISTDEVYGSLSLDDERRFTEDMRLSPNSPYSASKAGADLMVMSYFTTFGLPVNITRCTNNYGPKQYPEKLIPLMIKNSLENKKLPVYGDGLYVRDWIHVFDHCDAIETVAEKGTPGEIYNIGGGNEKNNMDIVRYILKATGRPESLIEHVKDRPGHDRRYAMDDGKIRKQLGWAPEISFEEGMENTVSWYIAKYCGKI